ncbi:uncharacterized protein [Gossypium hirsutum]|uniref:Integrase catalytic domain-containing protein n=1 Tax=Gossypium hirsutum TaxID=3635 RepID=A0A1U8IK90_GOSHI|nr:uncharacterized protein LOC107895524 [Gossypium hirsutum]
MAEKIISNNALNLNNSTISEVCSQFKIRHHNSSLHHLKMNGEVEVANKNIKKIMGKMTKTYKYLHKKLPFALYAYQRSIKTFNGATPFLLVYEMQVVLPIEVEIPSLQVLLELKLDKVEWLQSRYDQLNLIEEKRLKAIRHEKSGTFGHTMPRKVPSLNSSGNCCCKRIPPMAAQISCRNVGLALNSAKIEPSSNEANRVFKALKANKDFLLSASATTFAFPGW